MPDDTPNRKYSTNTLISTNYRTYSEQDCYDSGFRDGSQKMRFYPCTEWELVEGDFVRGKRTRAEEVYRIGYAAGKLAWEVRR